MCVNKCICVCTKIMCVCKSKGLLVETADRTHNSWCQPFINCAQHDTS